MIASDTRLWSLGIRPEHQFSTRLFVVLNGWRTYYLYEFLAKDDKRVVMSAAAAGGTVCDFLVNSFCNIRVEFMHIALKVDVFETFETLLPNSYTVL